MIQPNFIIPSLISLENLVSIPTHGETYARLMEHLRKAQEESAMMAHLHKANDAHRLALSWLAVSEKFKQLQHQLTILAQGRLQ
jgi:hypothetical protein